MIKDSGNRREFESGAVRDMEKGKGRCDLLPAVAILRVAKHFEEGAIKYGDRNWEKGIPIDSFIDSGLRHLLKYMDKQTDEDHLCAAAWNLLCAMWTEEKIEGEENEAEPKKNDRKQGHRKSNRQGDVAFFTGVARRIRFWGKKTSKGAGNR